jgi:hypothetical protein
MPESEDKTSAKPFKWTAKSTSAAELLGRCELTDLAICDNVQVSRMCLHNWKQHPDFAGKVASHRAEYAEIVRQRGIAILEQRVDALNDRWLRMRRVIESRSRRYIARREKDEEATPEEAETGLVVLEKTYGKMGVTEKWAVDTGLLAELRNHEKQAAQELGQWTEKKEISGNLADLSDEQLERIAAGKSAGGT